MKKRYTKVLLYSVMLSCLLFTGGCGKSPKDLSDDDAREAGNERENEDDSHNGNIDPQAFGVLADKISDVFKTRNECYILSNAYADSIFVIDTKGSVSSYDSKSLMSNIPADSGDSPVLCECSKDTLYFYVYNYDKKAGNYVKSFYAVDAKTNAADFLLKQDDNGYIYCTDYYDGALHLEYEMNNSYIGEYIITRSDSDGKYLISRGESPVQKTINDKGFDALAYYCPGSWDKACLARIVSEAGYVFAGDGENYIKVFSDGSFEDFYGFKGNDDAIIYYDEEYVIFSHDESGQRTVYCLNAEDDSLSDIDTFDTGGFDYTAGSTIFTLVGVNEGRILYYEDASEEYGLWNSSLFSYDPATGEKECILSETGIPGVRALNPSSFRYKLIGDELYGQEMTGERIEWEKLTIDNKKVSFEDTGCIIEDISAFKYGKVISDTRSVDCPYCGLRLNDFYEECFVLNPEYSPNADAINESLSEKLKLSAGYYDDEDNLNYDEEECEWHRESPSMYHCTEDMYVSDIDILGDRYLTVDMTGYWYGGGAHGYPLWRQYLYDLETGAEMTLADFYEGSTESFKELVANATVDDLLTYDEESCPYYVYDADTVYENAYEEADPAASFVVFRQDGVYVVYSPYDMGPYASGWIEVFISYDDLLGRSQLNT